MKILNYVLLMAVGSLLFACSNNNKQHEPQRGAYQQTNLTGKGAIVVADTVTYDAIIKNPNLADEWRQECLRKVDRTALSNAVFEAVYAGKLTAYDKYDSPMNLDEVKAMEADSSFLRSKIGKMQFIEEWYYDDKQQQFGKRVNSIMFGYELYDLDGEVRGYQAGIKVYFNGYKPAEQ